MLGQRYWIIFISGVIASTSHLAAAQSPGAMAPAAENTARTDEGMVSRLAGDNNGKVYIVKDGNKVDSITLLGWKTWRAMACERCHGAEQEGLVGPSLVEALKTLSKDEFHTTVINGRPGGMPAFGSSAMVTENWEGLYAYLKGRSDGQINPGHLYPIGADN